MAVYAAKKTDVDTIVRADHPVDLLRNSIATPSLVAAIMNAKYTNAIPLYRIAVSVKSVCDLDQQALPGGSHSGKLIEKMLRL